MLKSAFIIPIFLFGFNPNTATAQNLVPNSSFENVKQLPDNFCQNDSKSYTKCLVDWYSPNYATPDIWHAGVNTDILDYKYSDLTNAAKSGTNMSGIVYFPAGWSEYIQCKLVTPLAKSKYYYGEMWTSSDMVGAEPRFGLLFTPNMWQVNDTSGIYDLHVAQPQIPSSIRFTTRWHKIAGVFQATEKYEYLSIGIFARNSSVEKVRHSYTLIDDVLVREISKTEFETYEPDLSDRVINKGDNIRLKNIEFETAKVDLLPTSFVELDKLLLLLKTNPNLRIGLEGHTDNKNTADFNQKLSEERAKAVYDYLIAKKVAANQITYAGYGKTKPIADNNTEAGRALNRCVSVAVLAVASNEDLYLAACRNAKRNQKDSAFYYLQLAQRGGMTDLVVLFDPDLNNLKQDPRWLKIKGFAEIDFLKVTSRLDKNLALGLYSVWYEDQMARQPQDLLKHLKGYDFGYPPYDSTACAALNAQHRKYIDAVITPKGVKFDVRLDTKANEAIFLTVLHSNSVAYMQTYLPLMEAWIKRVPRVRFLLAEYRDKLLVLQNKPQIYGTQRRADNRFYTVENPETLNYRRATMVLEPLNADIMVEIMAHEKK